MRLVKLLLYAATTLPLTHIAGCAFMFGAPIGGYRVSTIIDVSEGINRDEIFNCARIAARNLKNENGWWDSQLEVKGLKSNTIESNRFTKHTAAGIRFRLTINPDAHRIYLKINATGPYFMDLGAQDAAADLKSELMACLSI